MTTIIMIAKSNLTELVSVFNIVVYEIAKHIAIQLGNQLNRDALTLTSLLENVLVNSLVSAL